MMGNPFYGALGGGRMSGPMGGFAQMIQQFNQFKSHLKVIPRRRLSGLCKAVKSRRIS